MATWGDVYISIEPYYLGGQWLVGTTWVSLKLDTEMFDGMECFINVSQDCILDWDGYHFDLAYGSNLIAWEPTTVVIPLTLIIPSVEDIVATIPLTLTIPTIKLPPEEDWWAAISAWLTENWYMAVAGIIIFLIGIFVWARYK